MECDGICACKTPCRFVRYVSIYLTLLRPCLEVGQCYLRCVVRYEVYRDVCCYIRVDVDIYVRRIICWIVYWIVIIDNIVCDVIYDSLYVVCHVIREISSVVVVGNIGSIVCYIVGIVHILVDRVRYLMFLVYVIGDIGHHVDVVRDICVLVYPVCNHGLRM